MCWIFRDFSARRDLRLLLAPVKKAERNRKSLFWFPTKNITTRDKYINISKMFGFVNVMGKLIGWSSFHFPYFPATDEIMWRGNILSCGNGVWNKINVNQYQSVSNMKVLPFMNLDTWYTKGAVISQLNLIKWKDFVKTFLTRFTLLCEIRLQGIPLQLSSFNRWLFKKCFWNLWCP